MSVYPHEVKSGAMRLELRDQHNNLLNSMTLSNEEYALFIDYAAKHDAVTAFWDHQSDSLERAA